jgi:hypothetical protein
VTVEYHPRHVEANRLQGTRSSSGAPFIFFGLLLPGIGVILTAVGLGLGWRTGRLLRLGLPADGYIETCRLPTQRSHGSASAGESTVTWSSSRTSPALPLAEFREQAWAQQQAALATARKLQDNPAARGCGWTLAFLVALFFGGGFGALSLAMAAVGILSALDQPAARVLHVALAAGGVGALLGTSLLMFWLVRKQRQRLSPEAAMARPAAFNRVECTLSFYLADGESTGQTKRTLSLTGDDADEQPRPLLYDPKKPARTLLLDEIGLPLQVGDTGQWLYAAAWPVSRLALVLLALSVPVVAWFVI